MLRQYKLHQYLFNFYYESLNLAKLVAKLACIRKVAVRNNLIKTFW